MIAKIKRVNDTSASLSSTSRTIKKQWAFETDTNRLRIHKNDDTFVLFDNNNWETITGGIQPAVTYDEIQLQGSGNLSFRKSASAWGTDWNALEMGTGVYSINIAQKYNSADNAVYYGDAYHNGTNWTKAGTARTSAIHRTDDDSNPGWEISESPTGTGNFTWSNMFLLYVLMLSD